MKKETTFCLKQTTINQLLASYMVAVGCNLTIESNWSFDTEELSELFEIDENYFVENQDDILTEINKFDAVAEVSFETDNDMQYFYITFYDNYCNGSLCREQEE